MIPQLRIRTEFSFRQAYGPIGIIAETLSELGTPAAGMVDTGTWGHVRWQRGLAKTAVRPMFGAEFTATLDDGRRPIAWTLMQSGHAAAFYRLSTVARRPETALEGVFAAAEGKVIRFAGSALVEPAAFDYVDINPASPIAQRKAIDLSARTGRGLVLTSDNAYPAPVDFGVFMAFIDRQKVTPQHLLSLAEMRKAFRILDDAQFDAAVRNTFEAAERTESILPKAPLIHVEGNLRSMVEAGRKHRLEAGHLKSWPEEYEIRLQHELSVIESKHFESYLLVVSELVQWAKARMLVGPGRGSSAGSLLCYLLGITEVDPIPHGLLFERFIDLTRKDLPDIDIDFSDTHRDECYTHLAEIYGSENVARVGSINTLKPRSVLMEVCKRFDIPLHDKMSLLNVLIEHASGDERYGKSLEDTLAKTDAGIAFSKKYPEAAVMGEIENHASHTGKHAAGVIVSNQPVSDYCTIGPDGVAHIDKKDLEALNLLKIDALGLRTLGIIEDSGVVTADRLYGLPLDDPKVFAVLNEKRFAGVFQFEGQAQAKVAESVRFDEFRTIDHVTALCRPGPLGGGAATKYIERKAGRERFSFVIPQLADILSDTFGVILYQEQVMRIVREIGKFTWEETTAVRKAIGHSLGKEAIDKMEERFVIGAATDGVSERDARHVWSEISTFGGYGMNRAHTCSYAVISYWCAWMKAYYPLEYAAATLRHAKDDDSALAMLREIAGEGIEYVAFDIDRSQENWSVVDGKLIGGFTNLEGIGPVKAAAAIEARNNGTLDEKMREKLLAHKIKFNMLYPIRTKYADYYRDPISKGCREGSEILHANEFPESGSILYIGEIMEIRERDFNEKELVERRNGKVFTFKTKFLDLILKDDGDIKTIARIQREKYDEFGKEATATLVVGDVVLIRGDKIKGYPLIDVTRVRCISRPGVLE